MSDIFVSYSSHDRERAGVVARALEARGWSVWWDRTIPPGRQFDDVIEEALGEARCVVVLWSASSAGSAWVKNEASEALSKKALIPALLEAGVKIPFEFRRVQAADLSRWQGEANMPEFVQLCDAIAAELDGNVPRPVPPAPPPGPAPAPAPAPAPTVIPVAPAAAAAKSKKAYFIGGGIVLVLVGIASMVNTPQPGPASAPMPMPMPAQEDAPLQEPIAAPAPAPAPQPQPSPQISPPTVARPAPGVHQNLQWRDHALSYFGRVSWDGNSNLAFVTMSVADTLTKTSLGNRQLQASVNTYGQSQIVMSTNVAVAGDSITRGPHMHSVNLIFQALPNGGWAFVHNCMSPNDCY
jgi:hypothetical protein